jgi:hypothetical protein
MFEEGALSDAGWCCGRWRCGLVKDHGPSLVVPDVNGTTTRGLMPSGSARVTVQRERTKAHHVNALDADAAAPETMYEYMNLRTSDEFHRSLETPISLVRSADDDGVREFRSGILG